MLPNKTTERAIQTGESTLVVSLVILIFYWPGWLILRIISVGNYPPPSKPHNMLFVATVAIAVILAGITFYFSAVTP